jgi:hypothetical protein
MRQGGGNVFPPSPLFLHEPGRFGGTRVDTSGPSPEHSSCHALCHANTPATRSATLILTASDGLLRVSDLIRI